MNFRLFIFLAIGAFYVIILASTTTTHVNSLPGLFDARLQNVDHDKIAASILELIVPAFILPPSDLLQLLKSSPLDFSIFFWKLKDSFGEDSFKINQDRLNMVLSSLSLFGTKQPKKDFLRPAKRALEEYIRKNGLEAESGWCNYYGSVYTHIISNGVSDFATVCIRNFDSFN
jgi:hypothetical protein